MARPRIFKLWYCRRCDYVHRPPLGATAVTCGAGHPMRPITEEQLDEIRRTKPDQLTLEAQT